jgi:amino acid adenylation domain-containing protein
MQNFSPEDKFEPPKIPALSPLHETATAYPLSFGQRALWFLKQLAPESTAYNAVLAASIHSTIDIPALRRAFQQLVERHPSLRTTFININGEPFQNIQDRAEIYFQEKNLANYDESFVNEYLAKEIHHPFDLEQGPLLRVNILTRDIQGQENILLIVMHHIITDFWSLAIMMRELDLFYPAQKAYKTLTLPPLEGQYVDYVRRQTELLADPERERLESYWQMQLKDLPPLLQLPTDRPRPGIQTYHGATHTFIVSKELTQRLKAFSSSKGVTLYMLLLAAFQILLYRYTGQEDILVGSPTTGKERAKLANLVGYFVNLIILRANFCNNPSFDSFLQQVRQIVLSALAHQNYPLSLMVEKLRPERDSSYSPIFQVMFVLQQDLHSKELAAFRMGHAKAQINIGDLLLEPFALEQQIAQFDLTLTIAEVKGELVAGLQYDTDLFKAQTIMWMATHYLCLLENILINPKQSISALSILSRPERECLLSWGAARGQSPSESCLPDLFEAQVAQRPEAIALVCETGQLTYQALNERANQLARELVAQGVHPETLVGLYLQQEEDFLLGLLAVLKAGGAYVPLDPHFPPERLHMLLADAHPFLLLTERSLLPNLNSSPCMLLCLDEQQAAWKRHSTQNLQRHLRADNAAYVMYTSGSTGSPKGVVVSHRNVIRLFAATEDVFHFTHEDTWTLFHSLAFDFSVWELWGACLHGGRLVVVPYWQRREPLTMWQILLREHVTVFNQTPSAFRLLIQAEEHLERQAPLALRLLIFGGEELEVSSLQPWLERHGDQAPTLINMYGITETTVHVTWTQVERKQIKEAERSKIGKGLSDLQVYVLDAWGQLAPLGVPGEVFVGGAGLARGYLGRPDLTAERFLPDPWSNVPGARLYKTGDVARYLPDGTLEYLGRNDNQVKVRGYRIELGEIEAVLGGHAAVQCCLAQLWSEEQPRIVAYVVPRVGHQLTRHELYHYSRTRLPGYMLPAAFVFLEAFPLTVNGKVDRRALPLPEREGTQASTPQSSPQTPLEELLAQIWAAVLGVEDVGVEENFFELGGDSLIATQLIARVRNVFRVEIQIIDLFKFPTIAGLAQCINTTLRQDSDEPAILLVANSRPESIPLSFAQQGFWLIDLFEPGRPLYNINIAFRLTGKLDINVFQHVLHRIICRHEILRTSFVSSGGMPTQVVLAPPIESDIFFYLIDLHVLSDNDRKVEIERIIHQEQLYHFNLAINPLIRFLLLYEANESYILSISTHHIIFDGRSLAILEEEIAVLYSAFSKGLPSPLPDLPCQYADYALWQAKHLREERLERQLTYWKEQLAGAPPFLGLVTDRSRPPIQTYNGATRTFSLPPTLTYALKRFSQQEEVTLFMVLLAAFNILLSRYSGQDDILVGVPIANKTHPEIEGLIGCFLNILVMRTDLSNMLTFRTLLKRVCKVALDGFAHPDVPLWMLVEMLHLERDLSSSPLFQVMFDMQDTFLKNREFAAGIVSTPLPGDNVFARYDLTLIVKNTENDMYCAWEYNTDLFDEETILQLQSHWQNLLQGIIEHPEMKISEFSWLTSREYQRVLIEWNKTAAVYPTELCIHQLFEAQAERIPDSIAIVFESEYITYGELNHRADQLACSLQAQGVGPEVCVGFFMESSIEALVGLLGILKAGGAYVPLDVSSPDERLISVLQDAQIAVLLTQERLLPRLPKHSAKVICLDRTSQILASGIKDCSEAGVPSRISSKNVAYVIYTSGSTGRPKGVMVYHQSLVNAFFAWKHAYNLHDDGASHLQMAAPTFDVFLGETMRALCSAGKLVLCPEDVLLTPERLFNLICQEYIAYADFVPAVLRHLVSYLQGIGKKLDFMRVLIAGSDSWMPDDYEQFHSICGENTRLINAYGLTETTIGNIYFDSSVEPVGANKSVPIGRPFLNTRTYVLDRHQLPVAVGMPGELYLGGECIARCYLNYPDITAERFVPDPFSGEPGACLYRTGDRVRYLPDANIEFLGRVDHQIKVRGYRIEPGEIEAVLIQHPKLQECVVTMQHELLVAHVVVRGQPDPSTRELRDYLQGKLPDYMIPSHFLLLEALPLTRSGKVDRRALPIMEAKEAELEADFVSPGNPIEEVLGLLWIELLHCGQISIHRNFFELGGHSLLALRLIALIQERFPVKLPLRSIFEAPTIAQLAQIIEELLIEKIEAAACESVKYSV